MGVVWEWAKGRGDDGGKKAARVVAARRHIVENILTMRCPVCGQVQFRRRRRLCTRTLLSPSIFTSASHGWMRCRGRG